MSSIVPPQIVSEPLFWLASTIFSVILSVVGNVATPPVVAFLERRSRKRFHRRRHRVIKFYGEVVIMRDRPDGVMLGILDGLHGLVSAIFFFVLALGVFLLSGVAARNLNEWLQLALNCFLGSPLVLFSLYCARDGMWWVRVARTVQRRERAFQAFARKNNIDASEVQQQRFFLTWDMQNLGTNVHDAVEELKKNPLLIDNE